MDYAVLIRLFFFLPACLPVLHAWNVRTELWLALKGGGGDEGKSGK